MMMKALITGAQGALGSQVIETFLKAGYEVVGTSLPGSDPKTAEIQPHRWIEVDLTDARSIKSVFQNASFDVLIHCAGGFRFSKLDQLSDEDLEFLLNTNLKSSFFMARQLLPAMKQKNYGRMIFISANATFQPKQGMSAYTASKAGLNALTASLADEVKSFDININAILPTIIDTPTNRKEMPQADHSTWVAPRQIAEIILTLVSPWGKPIHGALIPVSGRV